MRKWYNAAVILMFVVGVALIAGSVIYYIWAVERLGDIGESGDDFLPELPAHGSDDFRLPPRKFSAKERPHETEKDNGTSALPNLQELQAALAQFAVKRG
ncbi:MAG: hypothetical protein OXP71_17955 [Candidatus Poribacteria bacterium]|nr:hypothetical protein [Candidatus Poribacteria bacterium]